jgi:protoheme IX farnesyltransferase
MEAAAVSPKRTWKETIQLLVVLFKLRIVTLLLLAAAGGAFLGAPGWPGLGPLLLVLITGGMAASGASALNQYLERESDKRMGRTRKRPLPAGMIQFPKWVLAAGMVLVLLPVLAVLPFNPALAFFLLIGAIIYVGIYTIWLKPRSVLNIVIGGAAGSAAVLSGGAAVSAWQTPGVLMLALLLFVWTPTHFWSLAMMYRQEYQRADMPMLPARASMRQSALWVLLHTAVTGLAAIALGVVAGLGWLYLLPVGALTAVWLWRNGRLLTDPTPLRARSLFMFSNIYLMAALLLICLTTVLY